MLLATTHLRIPHQRISGKFSLAIQMEVENRWAELYSNGGSLSTCSNSSCITSQVTSISSCPAGKKIKISPKNKTNLNHFHGGLTKTHFYLEWVANELEWPV